MSRTDNTTESARSRGVGARLSALMKRASSLAEQGMYDEALANIKEAMDISPQNPRCSVQLANIYRAQNRIGLALDAMRKAVELDPRNSTVQEQLLQTLVELGRYDEAISVGGRLLRRSPKNLYARDVLSIAYLQLGRLEKAIQMTNELIRLAPTDSLHHFKKAVLLQQMGEIAQAMTAFTRALDMDPDGEMAEDAREAIAALDGYQLRQILTIAVEDTIFKAKLMLDPESACQERGFLLSSDGVAAISQMDLASLTVEPHGSHFHYH